MFHFPLNLLEICPTCEKLSKLHVWLLLVFVSKIMQLGILVIKGHAKWSDF